MEGVTCVSGEALLCPLRSWWQASLEEVRASELRTERARWKREPLKSDRSSTLSPCICISGEARCMQYACQACSWQRSRHTIGADWNINKQRRPVQKMFHQRATSASKRENNGPGAQVEQPGLIVHLRWPR